ncbi:TetR/AcrR family transcriptional regulator [Parvibaculum sp.]|uniref:TetR/AcrR family transcriptional regulator n=1 Tax=Parvibaculum sp. TaxID=2024848 RepID=UPI001B2E0754|nr:TetR/AcrR family transcriptional regulator [Parvibaculum sp.]MBO6666913.1 TetR/AcrR family transcriptional regulator [Parvibaculum sp.]MBO6691882.1 TetR/AcrR family transcriptional regulator [Parvibaculum sp.]MBO6713534.1 TetR/AcrR family transcriptional regulator [Parvibaculum sp.]
MAYRQTDKVAARLADTRRSILDAARGLVAEGGFAAVQMSEVAKKAGVATGTLYRYFSSKEALCRHVFREVSAREMGKLAEIASGDEAASERLVKVLETFAGRAVRGRRLAYALLAEPLDVNLAEERSFFRRTHAEIFAGILEDGIENGELPKTDVRIAAACIAGAIPTALIGPLAPESHELDSNPDRVVAEIVKFCLAGAGIAAPQTQQKTTERRKTA